MNELNSKASSTLSRLGNCEVCGKQEARYACPKCEVKTCCLACVQIHKRELNCDGIRDRTKFLPLSAITDREFLSDYCFLEECTRFTETRQQDCSKRYTHQQGSMPVSLHRMRTAAAQRGIHLKFLLPHFSRHKANTTYLNWKERRFYWHIEWLFVHAASESTVPTTCFVDTRCDEDKPLAVLLNKYLDVAQQTALEQHKLLHNHQTAGIGQLSLWLRAEGVQRSGSRCYALAAQKSLRENLSGKTIIEFPAIYISYEQRPPAGYDIIDSDEEAEEAANTSAANKASKREQQFTKSDNASQVTAKRSKANEALTTNNVDIFEWAANYKEDANEHSDNSSDDLSDNDKNFGLASAN